MNEQHLSGGSIMRLRGLIRKEFLQVVRDPSSLGIAFVLPIVLLVLFGYGVSLDAKYIPIAVVVEQPTADTTAFCGKFEHSRYFVPHYFHSLHRAVDAMRHRQVDAIVHLRSDFGEQLRRLKPAEIQVIVNGVDANNARIISGYVRSVFLLWASDYLRTSGEKLAIPIRVEQRSWFNANVRSRNFLVPGVIAVIMTLIGALLTALLMAREWERGTMEALLVTPVSVAEILLGKMLPYFLLGMGGLLLSALTAVTLFEVPLRGSTTVLLGSSALFLLAALGMGLLISSVTRIQFVAAQVAIITTFLPAFILSGFIFDIGSMPRPIQWITYIVPARYYVTILQTVFLAGDVWPVILPNAAMLAVMAALFLAGTRRATRKRLD